MQPPRRKREWKPEATVSFWINHASRRLLRLADARLRSLGVSMGQLPVLMALYAEEPLSQKELARRGRVEQPTMAELLARMQRAGIVTRAVDPDDSRGSLISLSKTARANIPEIQDRLMSGYDDVIAGITPEEEQVMLRVLQRIVHNVDALGADAGPKPRRR